MITNRKKIQHLLWRSGFGSNRATLKELQDKSVEEVTDWLFNQSKSSSYIKVIEGLGIRKRPDMMTPEEKKALFKAILQQTSQINIAWFNQLGTTNQTLREKMTLFWHGHFACRAKLAYLTQQQNNTMRNMALGKFSDLLMAVSKDPAMLEFLNNQQNRKQSPNENFAREVMELFTMGRGNYTEDDIKNAARAFTGWEFGLDGQFVFRQFFHDYGDKVFLGNTGDYFGEDIINIILEKKATADFITKKIYKFFVNDTVDEDIQPQLAKQFYESGYDIEKLMRGIFTADWFYDEKNIGVRIKSPIELMTGISRTIPLQMQDEKPVLYAQKILGQVLFYPPNVAGWPGGRQWIDSSSLMFRLKMPEYIFNAAEFEVTPKDDQDAIEAQMMMDDQMAYAPQTTVNKLNMTADWQEYISSFNGIDDKQLFSEVFDYVIQPLNCDVPENTIQNYSNTGSREEYIKSLTVRLMSLPEYQMC
jgi:uncharacterized protein (DUF1800 family)